MPVSLISTRMIEKLENVMFQVALGESAWEPSRMLKGELDIRLPVTLTSVNGAALAATGAVMAEIPAARTAAAKTLRIGSIASLGVNVATRHHAMVCKTDAIGVKWAFSASCSPDKRCTFGIV